MSEPDQSNPTDYSLKDKLTLKPLTDKLNAIADVLAILIFINELLMMYMISKLGDKHGS